MDFKDDSHSLIDCNNCLLNRLTHQYLNEDERNRVCGKATQLHFKKGESILKQGATSTSIGFLHKGIVKFTYQKDATKNYIMTVVSGPKLIGQANLFFKERNIFSIIAIEDCDTCFFNSRDMMAVLENHGNLLLVLVDHSSDMFQSSIFNFISLAHNHVYGRIADILIFLWENVYKKSEYDFSLTRKEISEFAACSHENVISVLSNFNREGLITFEGRKIIIKDLDKLKEISKNG
ncbi:MAG: Crp/Fnr family transcriptional regulator [Bacteroidales bacterium]|nr:Crp/Fnr family transcriptional regulator [Bacteroidales bacterium]MDD4604249.1 Crp/Fnr family transcriptional regulator [Bacteroidales bacterium]